MKKQLAAALMITLSISTLAGCSGGSSGSAGSSKSSGSGSSSGSLAGMFNQGSSQQETVQETKSGSATVYEATKAEMYGVEMAVEDLVPGGASIELMDDGKAVFHYGSDDHEMTWTQSGSRFHIEDQYNAMDGTLENGVLVLEEVFKSSMTLTFTDSSGGGGSAPVTETANTGIDEDTMALIKLYEGDWYGMLRVNHAYDGYSKHADAEMYCTARFSFDEAGNVTAYFCSSVDVLYANFMDVTAEAVPLIESVVVNFGFFEGHTKDDVYLSVDRGLLNGVANIINDDGDEMDISLAFRRPGDEWTEDETNIYWRYAAKDAHLAVGQTAETLAAAWCSEYPTPIPPLSNIAGGGTAVASAGGAGNAGTETSQAGDDNGGGTSDFSSAGSAGNAVLDYEGKGILFFSYDDSAFTFKNTVFDGLDTEYEDGNVRMTFYLEYTGGLESRSKWLDSESGQPEYRSEETTIAGMPARVVHLVDATMFNQPRMYVMIDVSEHLEEYDDVFIDVSGNSFEDIDADRVYAIINSIRFTP